MALVRRTPTAFFSRLAALCACSHAIPHNSPHSKQKKPNAYGVDFFCLAGAGGFEPATHGFGVALNCEKALQILAFSRVSTPFPRKTVCRSCV